MVGDEYESVRHRGEAEVLVFDLVKLAEALLLVSLALASAALFFGSHWG